MCDRRHDWFDEAAKLESFWRQVERNAAEEEAVADGQCQERVATDDGPVPGVPLPDTDRSEGDRR